MDTIQVPVTTRIVKDSKGRSLLEFTFSNDVVDRAGDKIEQNFVLGSFRKNPMFLWGHRYGELPIGRVMKLWREKAGEGHRTMGHVLFVPKEIHPFAEQVKQMFEHDPPFLNAVSIGFIPLDRKELTAEQRAEAGMGPWSEWFTKSELIEVSAVTVPMNPDALQEAVKCGLKQIDESPETIRKGVDRVALKAWCDAQEAEGDGFAKDGRTILMVDASLAKVVKSKEGSDEKAEAQEAQEAKASPKALLSLLKDAGLPPETAEAGLGGSVLAILGVLLREVKAIRDDIFPSLSEGVDDTEDEDEDEIETDADEAEVAEPESEDPKKDDTEAAEEDEIELIESDLADEAVVEVEE